MKKIICALFLTGSIAFTAVSGWAAESTPFILNVYNRVVDMSDLPKQPYYEEDCLMVPLRKVSEALGYQVGWDSTQNAVTIEDSIQKAILRNGEKTVDFQGKLQIIDLSREIQNPKETVISEGCTYVPLSFFDEFLNTTKVEGNNIFVDPDMCTVD